jgi:hypothetical protein
MKEGGEALLDNSLQKTDKKINQVAVEQSTTQSMSLRRTRFKKKNIDESIA